MINLLIIFFADYAIFGMFAVLPYLWFKKRKEAAVHAATSAFIAWGVGKFLKDFFAVPRPFVTNGVHPLAKYSTDGSFPSNHTAAAFAIAASVYFHYPKFGRWLLLLALLIGISRILGGVHYPLDILGGATIGLVMAKVLTRYHSK